MYMELKMLLLLKLLTHEHSWDKTHNPKTQHRIKHLLYKTQTHPEKSQQFAKCDKINNNIANTATIIMNPPMPSGKRANGTELGSEINQCLGQKCI